MTYSRPYVRDMLMNHPHGDTFKEVRCLANCVETYIPDPDKEEQTRTQKILGDIVT